VRRRLDLLIGGVGVLMLLGLGLLIVNWMAFLREPWPLLIPRWFYLVTPAAALILAASLAARSRSLGDRGIIVRAVLLVILVGGEALFLADPAVRTSARGTGSLQQWALQILARPEAEVCRSGAAPCLIARDRLSKEVRGLAPTYVSLVHDRQGSRYIELDWGGGFLEARGLRIGPPGFRSIGQRLADGVWCFMSSPEAD
jgi:hypothetical protein